MTTTKSDPRNRPTLGELATKGDHLGECPRCGCRDVREVLDTSNRWRWACRFCFRFVHRIPKEAKP